MLSGGVFKFGTGWVINLDEEGIEDLIIISMEFLFLK
jgi:hypothetical protein